MRRLVLIPAVLLWCLSAHASAETPIHFYGGTAPVVGSSPTQHVAIFDSVGMIGLPVVTFGFAKLGRLIDEKRVPDGQVVGSGLERLGFLVGLGASYAGFKLLGWGTNVPVSWSSAAIGMGLGLGVGVAFLGLDAGLIALFKIKQGDTAAGVLALVTVIGWSVATTLFIKADPFHEASSSSSSMGQATAPLLSVSF